MLMYCVKMLYLCNRIATTKVQQSFVHYMQNDTLSECRMCISLTT